MVSICSLYNAKKGRGKSSQYLLLKKHRKNKPKTMS
jgi:hypothetical protein